MAIQEEGTGEGDSLAQIMIPEVEKGEAPLSGEDWRQKLNYQQFYFYLDSAYQFGDGWPDKETGDEFREEISELFRKAGWEVQPGRSNGGCNIAVRGKESLYLHPMEVSGVIRKDSVPEIKAILDKGTSFRVRDAQGFWEYTEMGDDAYRQYLESRRGEMEQALLQFFTTKRRNLFKTGDPSEGISHRFLLHRMETKDDYGEDMSVTYLRELIEAMAADGRLEAAQTKEGRGLRAAGRIRRKTQAR